MAFVPFEVEDLTAMMMLRYLYSFADRCGLRKHKRVKA
jgi:hypothetical protein